MENQGTEFVACSHHHDHDRVRPRPAGIQFVRRSHVHAARFLADHAARISSHRPMCHRPGRAEVWPNLMAEAKGRAIPVALVNARLSPRSEARFRRFQRFVRSLFRQLALITVAESEDLEKWSALGADRARLKRVGSVKFDSAELEEQMAISASGIFHLSSLTAESPVLLGGSTHHGEEDILADVFMRLRLRLPRLSLFLAPRHVERAREIRKRMEGRGLEVRFVSEAASDPGAKPHCIILDQTGQLPLWYGIATVAFVGKSLTAQGGQNPVEPIAAGVPVIFGPNMENFARFARN